MSRLFAPRFALSAALFAMFFSAAPASAQTDYFWNTTAGGTGTWNTTNTNWSLTSGDPASIMWLNDGTARANFGGTAGTVTLGEPVTAFGLSFSTTGYTLTGSTLTLAGPGGPISVGTGTASISSVIAGTAGLTKTGAGTLELTGTGNNTFTGDVTINGGVLSFNSSTKPQAIPNGSASVIIDGGTLRNTNTGVGGTFLAATHPILIGSNGGTLDTPGAAAAVLIYNGGSITPTGGGTTVTKSGVGTLRMTSVTNSMQKLVVTGGLWQSNTDIGFGAVPGSFLADAITLDGGGISVNAGISLSNNRGITLAAGGGTFNASSSFLGVGVISGVGSLTKTGANALTLTSTATYAGSTTIAAGTIVISGANNRLPTTTDLIFSAAGTLNLSQRSQTINSLSSVGAVGTINNSVAATTSTLTVGNGGGSGTYGGIIQDGTGVVALTKTGTGTQTLTGVNTYTGATTINAGTLAIGTGGSLAAGSAVTVNSTGTLAGTGTVNGATTLVSGGTLSPGTSGAGVLTIGGNTILNSGSNLNITAGAIGTNTSINIPGAATTFDFNTGSILNVALVGGFGADGSYTLVTMQSGSGVNVLLDAAPTTNGQVLGTYVHGTGPSGPVVINTSGLTLTAGDTFVLSRSGDAVTLAFQPVPEPVTVLGIAAGALGLGGMVRRRFRAASRV